MIMRLLVVLALIFAVAVPAGAQMDDTGEGGVIVSGVWGRPTVSGMPMDDAEESDMDMPMDMGGTSAVYMTVTNTTTTDLMLTAAETPAAEIAEIHETSMTDEGVMQMRPISPGIVILAGETVALEPGGFHVMLLNPAPLAPGEAFPLTLRFGAGDDMLPVMVGVTVQDFPPAESTIVVDAGTVWARPTASEAMMEDIEDMDMGDETEMGAGTSAVYMTIGNIGAEDDVLVAASTDAAGIVEIHETSMTDEGVMQMRPVLPGIVVPAGDEAVLEPGGYHVMLLEPAALVPGDVINLTLTFESGQAVTVAAVVEDRRMGGMMMDMGE